MGAGHLGLLLHLEHAPVVVDADDSRALQRLDGGLVVAHNHRGLLFLEGIDEAS